jgi:hypothetical protein
LVRGLFRGRVISHLFLPPCSPQLNPIEAIFPAIIAAFKKKLREDMDTREALRMAHFSILEFKDTVFAQEVASARHFIDVAYRREPFPFDPF